MTDGGSGAEHARDGRGDAHHATSRIVATTGIHNFRDYGGYPVSTGGRLVTRMLYRSGEPVQATDRDLALVASLNLSAVIDLRGTAERHKAPARYPTTFAGQIIFADGETALSAPHVEAAARAFDAAEARRVMRERYAGIPFRPLLVTVYRQYFRLVARGPTLVYCTAGKDRTGVLVALLQNALGVHRDDIFEDYLLTNRAGDSQTRVGALRDDLARRFGGKMSEEAVQVVTSVEPQFLDAALAAIVTSHGTIGAYLSEVLGVTPVDRQTLAENLIT
jgi:protein tyrosine/serine phosphatase